MNSKHLFSLLTNAVWDRDIVSVYFSIQEYEYLLRFCEVNRNGLVDRIKKEEASWPLEVLIFRISYLIFDRWLKEKDYRFLNLLYKFRAKNYLNYLSEDSKSISLRNRIEQILRQELQRG